MIFSIISVVVAVVAISVVGLIIYAYAYRCEQPDAKGQLHTKLNVANDYFYLCRGRIYVRDSNQTYFPLTNFDPESFETLPYFFAKDKNNVYYVARVADQLFLTGDEVRRIEGADPRSFEVLSELTARDQKYDFELIGYREIRRTTREN